MRVLAAAALLPAALAAPHYPNSVLGWTSTVSQTFSWFAGETPLNLADPSQSIYEVLQSRGEFSKLVHGIDKHQEIKDLLNNKELGLTFFAPNNEALEHDEQFTAFSAGSKAEWIRDALYYHTLPETIEYSRLGENMTLPTEFRAYDGTFGGHRRRIRVKGTTLPNRVVLNHYATISESDIRAKNGVIHKLDHPLIPPPDVMDQIYLFPHEFSITATALLKIDLQHHLEFNSQKPDKHSHNDRKGKGAGSTTFFVPTNAAWADLPRGLVLYLFSPFGETTLRHLMQFHTIPEAIVHSEWVKDDKTTHELVTKGDKGLEFEWDYHFDTLTAQKLPVHVKKTKSILPGVDTYNIDLQAHGVPAKSFDNVAQNGAHHILDVVLCPKHKEGREPGRNAEDWLDWKEWLFDWSKEMSKSDQD